MTTDDTSALSGDLTEFARAFASLAKRAHELLPVSVGIGEMAAEHLGLDPSTIPTVGQQLPPSERPNLQLALNELLAAQPESKIIGLAPELAHYGGFSLSSLMSGRFHGPGDPVPPVYDELPIDVGETLRCVVAGLWFLTHDGDPVIVGLAPGERHGPPDQRSPRLEVFAADPIVAESLLRVLADLRSKHNVYRRKVLTFSHSEYGDFGINFMARPDTAATDVILPPGDLASIQRHTIGIGNRAEQLVAAGRHLKRGLLLYGPPGTGKTHTISYLMAAMAERTVVVLQGPSVGALGYAAAIVRNLPPSMLVIEDIDLIASERGMPAMGPTNPLLFQLLNEMDGLTATDDVLFVLTTNRVDILEPALVARPGRVDHAVEIGPPDASGREQLLDLYLGTGNQEIDLAPIVERTEGVTASFIKELIRRATLVALEETEQTEVTQDHLMTALDELLDGSVPIVRSMLGAGGAVERSS